MATQTKTKAFDPNNLPKGFPPDGIMKQHGKPYITHVGLVWLANHRGKPWSGTIVSHDIKWNQQGHPHACVVVYKVWDDEQEHTDIGDACAANVGKMIAPHLVRMASTRAQNRALRAFVGYAGCTADELTIGDAYEQQPASSPPGEPEQPAPQRAAAPRTGGGFRTNSTHACPACGAPVWDNRETAKGKQPLWSCSRKRECPGGKFGWASWDAAEFDKRGANEQPGQASAGDAALPDGPPPYEDSDLPF